MDISQEQFLQSTNQIKDASHLVQVILRQGHEWVAHFFGTVESANSDSVEFWERGEARKIKIDISDLTFRTGNWTTRCSWELKGKGAYSWELVDCESGPEMDGAI